MQNKLNTDILGKIIYILISFILAGIISIIYKDFTYDDCLFLVAIIRFLFNLLGVLSNNGTYDRMKYSFRRFASRTFTNNNVQSYEEYVQEKKAITSLGFKLIVNASLIFICFIALQFR